MFNKTIIEEGPRYPQTVTVKNAPTSESVELLREMEGQIEKSHYKKFIFRENFLEGTVYQSRDMGLGWRVTVLFKLNGVEHIITERVEDTEFKIDRMNAYMKLIEAVTNKFREFLIQKISEQV